MRKTTKLKITIIAITTIALGSAFTVYAANEIQSHGRFEYKSDPSSTTADVVLDSEDLNTIYTEVKDGKTALATSINTATGTNTLSTNVNSLPTFEQLSNAIDYVKQAGVDEAYHQIATSPNLDSGTYGSVTDLASLESAITQDNNNLLTEVQNNPEDYGIHELHTIKVVDDAINYYSNLGQTLTKDISIFCPNKYQDFTTSNFYAVWDRWNYETGGFGGSSSTCNFSMSYNSETGILSYRCPHYYVDGGHPEPVLDIYLIY